MKVLLIGTGAGGNKAALAAIGTNGIIKDDVVLVNSTDKDIPKGFDGTVVILSPDNSGCGKERSIAKDITLKAIDSKVLDLEEKSENYDIAVIVSSVEGGTGSGSTPILAKYCNQMLGIDTHVIAFTGFESDVRGLQNTVEFFQEIDDEVMVQTIRNKAFLKAAGNSELVAEQLANKELARRLQVINGSMLNDSEHNIDTTDIYKVVNTKGYMSVEYMEIKESLMDTNDFDKICKKMIYESKSLKSNDPGQSRMAAIMNLSPSSEEAIDFNFTLWKETYGNPYEVFIHKQYVPEQPEYIAFISSGMKLPLDEIKSVYERYMEASSKVNKSNDDFFNEMSSLKGNSEDSKFNMGRISRRSRTDKSAFMSQFQTKPTKK